MHLQWHNKDAASRDLWMETYAGAYSVVNHRDRQPRSWKVTSKTSSTRFCKSPSPSCGELLTALTVFLAGVSASLHLSSHVFPASASPLLLILTDSPSLDKVLASFDALLLESRVVCSLKERLDLLWWLEPAAVRACFPHWVPVFTILFSLRLASRALLFATDRGVSTSVLVSHVDSVSRVQLSWYLGSIIASARLPPQPIGKIIHGRWSSSGLTWG